MSISERFICLEAGQSVTTGDPKVAMTGADEITVTDI